MRKRIGNTYLGVLRKTKDKNEEGRHPRKSIKSISHLGRVLRPSSASALCVLLSFFQSPFAVDVYNL